MGANYKKQHYVPQTYLEAWNDKTGKVRIYDKEGSLYRYAKVENVLYENDFYTKTVNDSVILTNDEKEIIFKVLKDYKVIYNSETEEKVLDTVDDFSIYYFDFYKWDIYRKDGTKVKKKAIEDNIEKVRITVLEEEWKTIENGWRELRSTIIKKIKKEEKLTLENINEILNFIIGQKWRTPQALETCKEYVENVLKCVKEEMGHLYEIEKESMGKALFKNQIARLHKIDNNCIVLKELEMYKKCHLVFFQPIGKKFLLSDNPILILTDNEFVKGKFNGIYMPITPDLMVGLFKGDSKKYSVGTMRNNIVRRFNKRIKENSTKYYLSEHELQSYKSR